MSSDSLPDVWRTKLRSSIVSDHERQVEFCRERDVIGFGWSAPGISSGAGQDVLDRVCRSVAKSRWSGWGPQAASQIRSFAEAPNGDFVWIRDTKGHYQLCQITGAWRFVSGDTSPRNHSVDLHQIRPVKWARKSVSPENAPGMLVNAFTGRGKAWCRIGSGEAREDFARWTRDYAWEDLNGRRGKEPPVAGDKAITQRLRWHELEDLVLIWLQWRHNCIFIPTSRQESTPDYEFALKPRKGTGAIRAQVKTGAIYWSAVNKGLKRGEVGFGFSAKGDYRGTPGRRCVEIKMDELVSFASSADGQRLLPDPVRRWFET